MELYHCIEDKATKKKNETVFSYIAEPQTAVLLPFDTVGTS